VTINQEQRRKQYLSPCPILAQARRPRSGEKGSLTQASSFRLGESSNSWNGGFRVFSLRRDLLAWARWTLAQN